jgi:hypothetical protein
LVAPLTMIVGEVLGDGPPAAIDPFTQFVGHSRRRCFSPRGTIRSKHSLLIESTGDTTYKLLDSMRH